MHRVLRVEVPANGARGALPASFVAGVDGPRDRQPPLDPAAVPGALRLGAWNPAGHLVGLVLDPPRHHRGRAVAGRAARLRAGKSRDAWLVVFHPWVPGRTAG